MLLQYIVILAYSFFVVSAQTDILKLSQIDGLVSEALSKKEFSSAVVLVGDKNGINYHKSFGDANTSTVFDLASLTKIFTALSILILQEKKLINVDDQVNKYLPEYKNNTTIKQLLLHISGLPAANHLDDYKDGKESAIKKICNISITNNNFEYSCTGYILLGAIIEKISGLPLDQFVKENIFDKLDMNNTCYSPNGRKVHDPRSAALNGVAGNAGIFSTAQDLSKLCSFIINKDKPVLSKASIDCMIDKYDVGEGKYRGLGWDIKTQLSGCIGNFPLGTIGHTGFLGTSMVIDPKSTTFIIILTNRLGDANKSILTLRREIANLVHSIVYTK